MARTIARYGNGNAGNDGIARPSSKRGGHLYARRQTYRLKARAVVLAGGSWTTRHIVFKELENNDDYTDGVKAAFDCSYFRC
jgi:hypothetical protein